MSQMLTDFPPVGENKVITLDGIRLFYREAGQGFPIILLHGWGGSAASFFGLGAKLATNFKLFILDLPGFGQSGHPFEPWDVDRYANFVLDFAQIQNLPEFIVLGHSFGGRISIKMAVKEPQKIRALILCASAGIKEKKLRHKLFYGIAKLGGKILKLPILNKGRNFAKKVLYKLARTRDYLKTAGVMKETFKKVIAEDLRPLLSQINLPVLIIWGGNDRTTPLHHAKIMHQEIKNSDLKIIDGARHGVHKEHPEVLGKAIFKFLDQQKLFK